jgi:hypothetical protein
MLDVAVLLQVCVLSATQDQFNDLDARVGQSMMQAGGPPDGLMSHVAYPDGAGFVLAEVWRAAAEGKTYVDEVLRPLMNDIGLTVEETTARPIWSFARP